MKPGANLLLIITLIFSSNFLFAQTNKGQVEGYIKDAQTGDVLPYTSVSIEGTTIGDLTDDKGFYQINSVNPGPTRLKVSFIGYQDTTISITVIGNKTIRQDVKLTFGTALEGVVITAQAYGQVKAINTQLGATNIKNVISEVKMRELPDANVAEALTRLPGVSVERSGGEAVNIRIRGVASNTTYINGMRLDGGLASIAPSMIGSVELSKAFMPDQDADVMGGSVDLKLREAPKGFKKDIELRTGYNNFTKSFKMQDATLLLSNRFLNDKLGVMLSLSYDRKNRGNDIVAATYDPWGSSTVGLGSETLKPVIITSTNLTSTQALNNRYGAALFTDYKLNHGRLSYNGFFSSRASDYQYANNTYTKNELSYNSTSGESIDRNFLNGISGEHELFGAKIDWGVSYSQSSSKTPEQLRYTSQNTGGMTNTVLVDTGTTINEFMAFGTHDIAKTHSYYMYRDEFQTSSNELSLKLNGEVPFIINEKINGYIKFGGKVRNIKRVYNYDQIALNLRSDGYEKQMLADSLAKRTPDIGWVKLPDGNYAHSCLSGTDTLSDFSMLGAQTHYFPDFSKVKYVVDNMADLMGHYIASDASDYSNDEQFYAGYIMAGINLGKMFTFTPGVRYEYNKYSTTAKYFTEGIANPYAPAGQQGTLRDTTDGANNKNWFPMIHLKFKPVEWFDVRISYTETVSRPGFDNMSPRYYQNQAYDLTVGNVNLKPQSNTNYDVYLSFYTGKIGLFTAGAFYKVIENQVFVYDVTVVDPAIYGLDPEFKDNNYSRVINNSKPGFIKGIEFDWQTQFSYLPGLLKGIILNANITMMQSETKYPFYSFNTYLVYDEFGKPKAPFQKTAGQDNFRTNKILGMPNMTGNIALGYEIGGFSGRISVYYQSATITSAQAQQKSVDEDKDDLTRLDVQLSQKVKKVPGLIFYLSLNNLTNNPDRTMLTFYNEKTTREERYGTSGDIGVRYKF